MAPVSSSQNNSASTWFSDLWDGAVAGDFSEKASTTKTASQIGVGLIPVVGQVADARDTSAALLHVGQGKAGAWKDLGFAMLAWIPLLGDFIKGSRGALHAGEETLARATKSDSWFSKPKIVGDKSLPPGYGSTDKYGNVEYSTAGSKTDKKLVYEHEKVHSFLSPKFKFLQEFRADLRMDLYQRSHFMRYLEEALAETYAQLKVNGLKGLPEGIKFPIENGYVELSQVIKEGALGTVAVGGTAYGVYLLGKDD